MRSRVLLFSLKLAALTALSFALSFPAPAQAPAGPQGTPPPQQQSPVPPAAPKQEPSAQQKPQDAGQTIAVEVPVVTLDVIATTSMAIFSLASKKKIFAFSKTASLKSLPTPAPLTLPSPWSS